MIIKVCNFCKKEFNAKRNSRKFCSRSCSGKDPISGRKGKHLSLEAKKKIKEHSARYWLGKKILSMTGNKNPNWKGGYENKLMLNRKRRILKKGNGGSHTLGEWETLKAQYNWTCYFCEKCEPEITLTEDHIIPLSRGGTDNIENIQPLCVSCNSKKGTKTIINKPNKIIDR